MNRLRELGKIKLGKRYTVYSPKDGQACLDHNHSQGEGIKLQEHIAIRMEVLEWTEARKELWLKLYLQVPKFAFHLRPYDLRRCTVKLAVSSARISPTVSTKYQSTRTSSSPIELRETRRSRAYSPNGVTFPGWRGFKGQTCLVLWSMHHSQSTRTVSESCP